MKCFQRYLFRAFHKICTIMDGVSKFPSILQDFECGKPILLIFEVSSNLPIPLVSTLPIVVPFWNSYIDNYVYGIFGFANKYLVNDGAILIFYDDDPHVLKEIKSLGTNGYEIHSRWVVINTLPHMNNEIKGKMVFFFLICIYMSFEKIILDQLSSFCTLQIQLSWVILFIYKMGGF